MKARMATMVLAAALVACGAEADRSAEAQYWDRSVSEFPALAGETLDFSFSGLKTAAINLLHHFEQTGEELPRALFAARYTALCVEAVKKKIGQALDRYPGLPLVAAGGVAANSHLRRELAALAKTRRTALYLPPLAYCGDNAAMIGAQGYYEYLAGNVKDSSLNASALDA